MDRTGQIFEGRYRLQRVLGQGGMATVYAARDEKLDKAVAVKVMDSELAASSKAARRFVQEARAVARVRHPNVIDITDYGVASDGAAFLVMELLRGEDLAATLTREGPLPWTRAGPIALQVCAALAAAHRVGVIHRDIKPSNLVRLPTPGNPDFIKVLDFGIAKVTGDSRGLVEPTTAGMVLGTPEYTAPEVAAGIEAEPRSDVYGLGACLYKLLTGKPLFEADNPKALLYKQMFDPPIPPRRRAPACAIPEAAERVVLLALAKEPRERPADMIAFARAIAEALPGRPALGRWLDPAPLEATVSMTDLPGAGAPSAEPAARARGRGRGGPVALALAGGALALAGALALRGAGSGSALKDMSEESIPSSPGDMDRVERTDDAAVPEAAPSAGPEDLPPAAAPVPAPAAGSAEPRPERRERFDGGALRRVLIAASPAMRACALASNMFRGEIALIVRVDGAGQVTRVGAAPGGRVIEARALTCIRRELAGVQLAGGAGELVHHFTI